MNYVDGNDSIGQKEQTQLRAKPKRRSVFYQQTSSLVETNDGKNSQGQGESESNPLLQLQVFKDDPVLADYAQHFQHRNKMYNDLLDQIDAKEGGLIEFARTYKHRGIWTDSEGAINYQEWAPGAKEMYLTGDFCNWDRKKHKMVRDQFGNWKIELPKGTIPHNTKVKVHLLNEKNQWVDKIPIYIKSTVQNEDKSYDGLYWNPEQKYIFKNAKPELQQAVKIYECHIGMSGIEPKVHSFNYFRENVIPRIKRLGYNCLQIMAIAEHPYYGSFGYHVSMPFGISSRFGTPDDFKKLVDEAHANGIAVLVDIVHSHAASNVEDGINEWDGSDNMYFHAGEKGKQSQWDSRLYNYSNWETLRLLLSNLLYFLEEYQVDGFRFDGVTSMLYIHHGIGTGFTGGYHEYFNEQVDMDSLVYLMLANKLIHTTFPNAISIAEDVSGYPTLCRTHKDGGVGFDYRLQMAVPDKWIKLLKEQSDDHWNMADIVHTLVNRRHLEPCIVYAESHDQALVGDKTIAMWLFDKEIYDNMSKFSNESIVVSRGIALHKMIRLITLSLGGEGYLNFMGNEFGHPEWIDFPREGNGWSYHHCRRRWDIVDDELLRYKYLNNINLEFWTVEKNYVSEKHEDNKVIVFEKGDLLFVFNFHPSKSYENYRVGTSIQKDHIIVLDTDETKFGGQGRLKSGHKNPFPLIKENHNGRDLCVHLYIPCRTAIVLAAYPQEVQIDENDEDLNNEEKKE